MLQDRGVTVYLVSGGFRWIIEYFADYLAIPKSNIHANRLIFDEEGMVQWCCVDVNLTLIEFIPPC